MEIIISIIYYLLKWIFSDRIKYLPLIKCALSFVDWMNWFFEFFGYGWFTVKRSSTEDEDT